jgi:hypothetical protein
MNNFIEISERLIESVPDKYIRGQIQWLEQPDRLIGIKGAFLRP